MQRSAKNSDFFFGMYMHSSKASSDDKKLSNYFYMLVMYTIKPFIYCTHGHNNGDLICSTAQEKCARESCLG